MRATLSLHWGLGKNAEQEDDDRDGLGAGRRGHSGHQSSSSYRTRRVTLPRLETSQEGVRFQNRDEGQSQTCWIWGPSQNRTDRLTIYVTHIKGMSEAVETGEKGGHSTSLRGRKAE